jgi:hypothetical protein
MKQTLKTSGVGSLVAAGGGLLALMGLSLFALPGLAEADTHHNGHSLIQGKGNGKHQLHATPQGHVAHAHVNNGKVQQVTVTHKGNAHAVRKFKTRQRLHALADLPGQFEGGEVTHFVSTNAAADPADPADPQVFVYVGFGFYNQFTNQWIVFWFPVAMVWGGDSGADEI